MKTFAQSLAAWLANPKNTQVVLAEAIGKSQPTVHRFARGERFPDADTARMIDAHTEGEVPFSAWKRDYLAQAGLMDEESA